MSHTYAVQGGMVHALNNTLQMENDIKIRKYKIYFSFDTASLLSETT